jgi:hypothetical protein
MAHTMYLGFSLQPHSQFRYWVVKDSCVDVVGLTALPFTCAPAPHS